MFLENLKVWSLDLKSQKDKTIIHKETSENLTTEIKNDISSNLQNGLNDIIE